MPSKPRDNFGSNVLIFLGALLVAIAIFAPPPSAASSIPRQHQDVATVKRFCTSQSVTNGPAVVGLQCQDQVLILTGKSLSDGGTQQSSDGGMPITPDLNSERILFPTSTKEITLGWGEKCVGVLSPDAGTNLCNFFDVTH